MEELGIYIHIPFCLNKCPYCDFYSVKAEENLIEEYVLRLKQEIKLWGKKLKKTVNTIYFGGGTPSLLGPERIKEILLTLKKYFNCSDPEITLEINPTREFDFKKLKKTGVNRLSFGVQSFNDEELKLLGRRHNSQMAQNAIKKAQSAGFNNISIDLMLGIQKQTKASLAESIKVCSSLGVQHVSAYILKIEENTPYFEDIQKLKLKTTEEEAELYLFAVENLSKFGFFQYEISNFCNKNKESLHNLKYWKHKDYLGIGPEAHSFLQGKRFYTERSLEKFLENPKYIKEASENLEQEYLMLRLRLKEGIIRQKFLEKFPRADFNFYLENAKKYVIGNFLEITQERIRLTESGFLVSNYLIARILDGS